jgi:hypothetical protein
MCQRDLVPTGGNDRDGEAVCRDLPGEGNLARRRGASDARVSESDVGTPVLSACIRVVTEREFAKHLPVGRPRPGMRTRGGGEHPRRSQRGAHG